ncbi:response regulator [Methanofollis fontis]|uniref:histidine kinase n=1 Tax=Methanofollis fontis TaxID=2052832 RepID=A0A483CMB4_9EURY|nr:response regulator [Methanofollis fontis]TAJ44129.1 hypothetical protein CUJ86_08855 [Methanofollis fontis]
MTRDEGIRLLLVDDEPAFLDLSSIFLGRSGSFHVDTVQSPHNALEQLSSNHYDAVVSDYLMAEMDGISFLKAVRSCEPDIPFIIFTGKGREEIVIEALNSGADAYLQKGGEPVPQYAELARTVRTLVDKRRAFRELFGEQERMRVTLNSMADGMIITDTDSRITLINAVAQNITGWSEDEADGRVLSDVMPVIPAGEGGSDMKGIVTFVSRNGDHFDLSYTVTPLRGVDGGQVGNAVVFHDVTAEKKARKYHKLLASIVESTDDAVLVMNGDGIIRSWNRAAERIYGYAAAEIIGKQVSVLLPSGQNDEHNQIFSRLHAGEQVKHFETGRIRKDGQMIIVSVTVSPLRDAVGRVTAFSSIERDVTAQREAENELRLSEEKYRMLFDNANDAIVLNQIQPDGRPGRVIDANPRMLEIIGCTRSDLCQRSIQDIIDRNFWEQYPDMDDPSLAQQGCRFTGSIRTSDGSPLPVEIGAHRFDMKGTPVLLNIIRDISERIAAERELRIKESAMESSLIGSMILDPDGRITYLNGAAAQAWDCSDKRELQGALFGKPFIPDGEWEQEILPQLRRGGVWSGEAAALSSAGRAFTIDLSVSSVLDAPDVPICYVVSFADITSRKQNERDLEASIEEKSILLTEIHHRVKNNLQIISGMIRLQIREIVQEEAAASLRECENRIITMALVHESLYQSGNLGEIRMREHIRTLADNLVAAEMYTCPLHLELDIEDICLDLDTAIPCSLIINELMTNSIKHAFLDSDEGRIWISMHRDRPNCIRLEVGDDGPGLPGGFDISSARSLGLRLVYRLVTQQLGGEISVSSCDGTTYVIRLPAMDKGGNER